MNRVESTLGPIHHYGVAAESVEDVVNWLEQHATVTHASIPIWDELQQAWLSLVDVPGGTLEIVAGPVVRGLLEKGRLGYHICFEVESLEAALSKLVNGGGRQVTRPSPAVLFGGRRVCFVHTQLGLVELLERTGAADASKSA